MELHGDVILLLCEITAGENLSIPKTGNNFHTNSILIFKFLYSSLDFNLFNLKHRVFSLQMLSDIIFSTTFDSTIHVVVNRSIKHS